MKKFLCVLMSIIMACTVINFKISYGYAETVGGYNAKSAVEYAKEHFDDYAKTKPEGGDCIEFVRQSLETGGIPRDRARAYGYTVTQYINYVVDNGYAELKKLNTEKQPWTTPQWYVPYENNKTVLSIGDGIVYLCKGCGKYFHASLCSGFTNDGYAKYYAQNIAVNDKTLCKIDCSNCKKNRSGTEIYSLHITSRENGYADYYNDISANGLKVIRLDNRNHKILWESVEGASGYRVFKKNSANGVFNLLMDTKSTEIKYYEETAGANYYFAVRPYFNESGKTYVGKLSDTVKTDEVVYKKLSAPTNLKASINVNNKCVGLSWNKVPGATSYKVYRATSKNGTYYNIFSGTGTTCKNSSITAGKTYYYKVYAMYSKNTSYNSNASNTVLVNLKVAKPTASSVNVASTGKIKLQWNKVANAKKYDVYRRVGTSGSYSKYYTTTSTSMTNTSAVAGKTYYYKVRAVSNSGILANSDYSYVYRTCDLARPTAKISNSTRGKLYLSWQKVTGASKYAVYRATSKNGTYSKITTTSKTSFTNTSVKKGKTYYYKVKALYKGNSSADSAYSSIVSKVVK